MKPLFLIIFELQQQQCFTHYFKYHQTQACSAFQHFVALVLSIALKFPLLVIIPDSIRLWTSFWLLDLDLLIACCPLLILIWYKSATYYFQLILLSNFLFSQHKSPVSILQRRGFCVQLKECLLFYEAQCFCLSAIEHTGDVVHTGRKTNCADANE